MLAKGFKRKFFVSYARVYPKIISTLLQVPADEEELEDAEADMKLAYASLCCFCGTPVILTTYTVC